MENPCVKYGEHLPHPDPKKFNCVRCGHQVYDPILTEEEIANGRREVDRNILEDNLELFRKATLVADRDKKNVEDVFVEMSRKEQ